MFPKILKLKIVTVSKFKMKKIKNIDEILDEKYVNVSKLKRAKWDKQFEILRISFDTSPLEAKERTLISEAEQEYKDGKTISLEI